MKRIVLIIVTVLISFTGLHSQDNYYWNYGRKEYMDYYPNKKYIVVDSSITSKTELASALNDTSLKINTFQESSVLIHLNIYDSTAYEKQYAILQSRDSINESEQLNNQVVNYVGPYYNKTREWRYCWDFKIVLC
ncbi:MAG TPA: hypothetical protein PLO05_11075 [Bacteroidales bacterium]|nr:hypothetical protein [Bacteroidales bacterium]